MADKANADRVNQIAQSNLWATTVIFITWDDWGGWYDHVEPPQKDTWKGGNPLNGPAYTNTQFSYGSRVGCLVLSPYAKKGISKAFHSHVSIVKFCEKTFGLPSINARDAASDDMSDCFDFNQAPLGPPAWKAEEGGKPMLPPAQRSPAKKVTPRGLGVLKHRQTEASTTTMKKRKTKP